MGDDGESAPAKKRKRKSKAKITNGKVSDSDSGMEVDLSNNTNTDSLVASMDPQDFEVVSIDNTASKCNDSDSADTDDILSGQKSKRKSKPASSPVKTVSSPK